MSKYLITGAAGFIGSQLAHKLWQKNEQVILLDNFSYGKYDNLVFEDHDFSNEILTIDVRNEKAINRLFEEESFDYVYHVAAITPLPDCQTNPVDAIDNNVKGTVVILEAGRKYGVKNIIFASTSAVYEHCIEFPTKEDDVIQPTLIYSNSKYTAEQFCKSYADTYRMNVTVLRFANVYGPHIDCLRTQPPVAGYIIRELFFNRPVELHSNGNQSRDFIYVDDLIDLALRARNSEGFDVFNVSAGKSYSINQMYEIIASIMHKEECIPEYLGTDHYWYRYPELYEGKFPIKSEIMRHEVLKHTECDNTHAFEKLGWEPKTDFKTGLMNTVRFAIEVLMKVNKDLDDDNME